MAPSELLKDAVERAAMAGHEGKSGAGLERVRLEDGRVLVVKRLSPSSDVTLLLSGGRIGRECLLWRAGVLDRLPPGVDHAVVEAWVEDDVTVIAMRDLDGKVLSWDDRLSAASAQWMVDRVATLHRHFLGAPPAEVTPLDRVLGFFAPHRIRELAASGNELMVLALRGWEIFAETVPTGVAEPVFGLLEDVTPLARALAEGPVTLTHGDLATVNMAFEGDDLVLLDWALATAGPGTLDVTRFLAGCWSVMDWSREDLLTAYAHAAGPAYDERSLRLSLLAALLWLGWNKALDAAEHPDPLTRVREAADLDWWVQEARTTLEREVL